MALSSIVVSQAYVADGVLTGFAIPFPMIESDSDEVKVYVRDESVDPATVTLKTEGVDYDLSGRPDPDSFHTTVTFVAAPANGLKVFVERVLEITQTYEPTSNANVRLENIETALDRQCALIQQLNFQLQKTLYFGHTSGVSGFEVPDPVANGIFSINAAGDGVELKAIADLIAISGALAIANNLSDLASVAAALDNLGISPLSTQRKFDFIDGQAATDLTGETIDGTVYTSRVYEYEVIRGTTILSTGRVSIQYRNSTWMVVDGGYEGDAHGLSFSVTQASSVAQVKLGASSSGGGNGTIKLKSHNYAV